MIETARCWSKTPASWTTIWLSPCLRTSGSETPSLSMRSRMMFSERSSAALSNF